MISPTLAPSKRQAANDNPVSDPQSDPMQLIRTWFDGAVAAKVRDPSILSLATADAQGQASNRIVRVLEFRDGGLVFTSHTGSLKGRQIAATGWASGVMYWPEIGQQVIVSGPTKPISAADSDALWAARSIKTHPMSTVSRQSDRLDSETALRQQAADLRELNTALPRPPTWVGYQLEPATMEFWQADPEALHNRLHYERTPSGWRAIQLQP
jgi:pyridoxamine 5'-phosphate oxidase